MNVTSVSGLTPAASNSAATKDESVDQNYAALIAQFFNVHDYQSRDTLNASDSELQQFKTDLIKKGAAQFLKDLNQEKIDALVEEYRQKLLKEKESNPDQPMDINQMVSDFKKELMKEMMEAQKADQQSKNSQKTALMSSDILENITAVHQKDTKSSQNQTGFLEQMLSISNADTKQKYTLF